MVADTPVKIGRPYQVRGVTYTPADDAHYDETGLASWYGPQGQHGTTANGERFDGRRVGAAHKTLPLPSYVEVTALASGRRILVRVNDRGPFVAGRIIDLSYGAAELLGIARAGTARVRVRRVYPSESDRRLLRSGRPALALPSVSNPLAQALPPGYPPPNTPEQRIDQNP
ncbi:rare lipoprotein A (peptidoglycan hydrolase) [Sphingomonas vulcanisoli]|uniref:Endolytic peptidoglycan transglycosylase RlpA n=1 Tax=Sphingomonas vulcanisoli TaxID=1658060 RepID=A0ABX0TN86_9SPHN|nr:rare lipoprotein A (peptidoglycan hydrolase) [Sphingomonas vulcanisoli]